MKTLRKNEEKMLYNTENNVTEVKNVFNGLINRLDMAEEANSELEGRSIESSHEIQTGKKKERKIMKKQPQQNI